MSIIQQAILASSSGLPYDGGQPLPGAGFPGTTTVAASGNRGTPFSPTGYQLGDTIPGTGNGLYAVQSGLFRKKCFGSFVDGGSAFFSTIQPVHTTLDSYVSFDLVAEKDGFSMEWLGYIKVLTTGTYNLCLRSDDQSALWIGDSALSGSTYGGGGNHLIDNITSVTNNVPVYNVNSVILNQNYYYPIKIRMQEGPGEELLRLYYGLSDGITSLSGNVSGIIWHNPSINLNAPGFAGF